MVHAFLPGLCGPAMRTGGVGGNFREADAQDMEEVVERGMEILCQFSRAKICSLVCFDAVHAFKSVGKKFRGLHSRKDTKTFSLKVSQAQLMGSEFSQNLAL